MSPTSAYYALQLRHELSLRNRAFALQRRLSHVESYGGMRVTVFRPHQGRRRHGNFFDESYAAVLATPEWRKRLEKVHTSAGSSLPRTERGWRELDSSMSSDALLMNIFCCPHLADDPGLIALLGINGPALPEFGFRPGIPLKGGFADRTEVDMKLGTMLFEAKLSEADFRSAPATILAGYRDLEKVFETQSLARQGGNVLSYQLVRNVLAAQAAGYDFCVLIDARRPDLLESWYKILRCVRPMELHLRCKVLTWQELSAVVPERLAEFLDSKYGIVPPGVAASPVDAEDGLKNW